MSDELDPNLNSLIEQLNDATTVNKKVAQTSDELCEDQNLTPEDLEAFVIKNSSNLVGKSLNAIDEIKDVITASGDPDSISALSDLIKASNSALDSLNKIVIQNKRSKTTLTAKTMDVQAKYAIEEKKNENALIASRDEMFKMIKDATVIEAEETTLDSQHQQSLPQADQK